MRYTLKTTTLILMCGLMIAEASTAHGNAILKPRSGETQGLSAKSLDVRAKIDGAFATITITTVYRNPNSQRIEADFIYAAPQNAVVTGFAYWFGEEKVVARVAEKKRAARIYQGIVSQRRDPALVEMIGKNSFRARIFPIEANQDLKIEIRYAQPLSPGKSGWEYQFPLREAAGKRLESLTLQTNGESNFASGQQSDLQPKADWRATVPRESGALTASLLARRDSAQNDGFFALQLVSGAPLSTPKFRLSGVQTYNVIAPSVNNVPANTPFLVVGRFKKSGRAVAELNGRRVSLNFGDEVENGSAARDLWAQKQIEVLSDSEKNRFQVVKLSQRFGLVSRWTNWLAIPAAERKAFERQIMQADLWNASRAYAAAVARGDNRTAHAQKSVVQQLNRKLGYAGSSLEYALNEELNRVESAILRAPFEKTPRADVAKLQRARRILLRAGANRRDIDEQRYSVVRGQIDKLALQYVQRVENGQAKSPKARQLRAKINRLVARELPPRYRNRSVINEAISQATYPRLISAVEGMVKSRDDGKWSANDQENYENRVGRLLVITADKKWLRETETRVRFDVLTPLLLEKVGSRIVGAPDFEVGLSELQKQWRQMATQNGDPNLQFPAYLVRLRLQQELRLLASQTPVHHPDIKVAIANPQIVKVAAAIRRLREIDAESYRATPDPRWKVELQKLAKKRLAVHLQIGATSPSALQLKAEMEAFAKKSGVNSQVVDVVLAEVATQRATDSTEALIPRILDRTATSTDLLEHENRLQALDSAAPNWRQDWHYWQTRRNYDISFSARAHEAAYRLLQAEKRGEETAKWRAELEEFAAKVETHPSAVLSWEKQRLDRGLPLQSAREYYRLRPGDPLISVSAPKDCAQVLAIMPDGTILPLRFDTSKNAWEARFDVPTWAPQGDYAVQIVVVPRSGARQVLTMHFAVDTQAPQGSAQVKIEDEKLRIRLQTDEQTDRISAFLSDGSRIELRRENDSSWGADAPPQSGEVRLILTDKAHNRMEIRVSPR